jgi:hypothetical protein
MNRLNLAFSIAKKASQSRYALILILASLIFFNGVNAFANDDYEVTGHYYLPDTKNVGKYTDAIQWKVTNISDWTFFVNKLQDLPIGSEIKNPLVTLQGGIVHFTQINPDHISGNDIYLSKFGIQQYARMPIDVYHYKNVEMRKFLEMEMDKNPGYGEGEDKEIDLSANGIIVIYRGSNMLSNPNWRVIDPEEFKKYLGFINGLKPLPDGQKLRTELAKTSYDDLGTFIVYLNYSGAPFQFMSVTPVGGVRGTKVNIRKFFFKDEKNYYSVFKSQAETIMRAKKEREGNSDLKRAQDRF